MGLGSLTGFSGSGDDGVEGGRFGFCGDVLGAGEYFVLAESDALRKFSRPLMFGTKKLYAIGVAAGGWWPRR